MQASLLLTFATLSVIIFLHGCEQGRWFLFIVRAGPAPVVWHQTVAGPAATADMQEHLLWCRPGDGAGAHLGQGLQGAAVQPYTRLDTP
jgi:hypothetical protein